MQESELLSIRREIDSIDDSIIELISRRYALVDRAVQIKQEHKLDLFSKEREKHLIEHFKELALKYSLPHDMLDDILKRLLKQSYVQGAASSYPCAATAGDKIVIVGGRGGMGSFFAHYFKISGYNVQILEKDDWDQVDTIVAKALCVIVSVPIDITCEVIKRLCPYLDGKTVLCDLTSVKGAVTKIMKEHYAGPSISLHPMFGPDTKSFLKQVVVNVPVNMADKCEFMTEQMRLFGAIVCTYSAEEHDEAMSIIQALRHFTTYCYGVFLSSVNANIKQILDLSSPIYRLELSMVGRLFAQDPLLYGDIIMSSKNNARLISQYTCALNRELEVVAKGDIETFVRRFNEAKDYFGDYADMFLKESAMLLSRYQELR